MLVGCCDTGLMMNETHRCVFEYQCSMAAQGLMDILSGNPFYFYIANLMAKLVSLPKIMIAATLSNVPLWIIHARDDEPCTTESGGQGLAAM